jgi:type 1 fimbria pilin
MGMPAARVRLGKNEPPDHRHLSEEAKMKKIALIAMAASAAIATPAAAQTVSGTITLTGSVSDKCLVVPGGGTSIFGQTVGFGELAQADGTLRAGLATEFNALGIGARVVCTTAAPSITVDATALATAAAPAAGYDNSIDFLATVKVDTTDTADVPFTNDSGSANGVATPIGGRLANNGGNNITVEASNFRTNALTDILVASPTYTGSIVVSIAPN